MRPPSQSFHTWTLFLAFSIIIIAGSCENTSNKSMDESKLPLEDHLGLGLPADKNYYGNYAYAIDSLILELIAVNKPYEELYNYPQIRYLADSAIQSKVNEFLKTKFIPEDEYIQQYQKSSVSKNAEKSESYWERTEVKYSIGVATKKFITMEYEYILEHEKMMQPKYIKKYFNINLQSGEIIDSLGYFFVEGYQSELEKQLNNVTEDMGDDVNYYFKIDSGSDYEFGFFEDKKGINLEIYIAPDSDSKDLESGRTDTRMSDYMPKSFVAPLYSIAELIDTNTVIKTLLFKNKNELQ